MYTNTYISPAPTPGPLLNIYKLVYVNWDADANACKFSLRKLSSLWGRDGNPTEMSTYIFSLHDIDPLLQDSPSAAGRGIRDGDGTEVWFSGTVTVPVTVLYSLFLDLPTSWYQYAARLGVLEADSWIYSSILTPANMAFSS